MALWPLTRPRQISLIALLWALLAAVFAAFDLDISVLVVDPASGWASFVARWGELPGLVVIAAALLIVAARLGRPRQIDAWLATFGLVALLAIVLDYAGAVVFTNVAGAAGSQKLLATTGPAIWALGIPSAAFVVATTLATWRRVSASAVAFARTSLWLAFVNVVLFVQVFKALWGRMRFRDLPPDLVGFTAWYEPQGVTGHTSFPSGHTALGWMLLPLIGLSRRLPNAVRATVTGLVIAWGLLVAAGRVRIGAHYASDVLFSTAVAWLVYAGVDSVPAPSDPPRGGADQASQLR